jgi:hypothetical protein
MTTVDPGAGADRSLDDHWRELVTAALLGTDRRDPPSPPPGPLADVVDDAVRPDAAARMLASVASVAAARRAAFVAGPPAASLQPPTPDERPLCSQTAVSTWRTIVSDWRVLEDEWVLTVIERGWRLPADTLVELLQRHRTDAVRRARVALAGGPVVGWLIDQLPELAPATRRAAAADSVASLPELPVPPEMSELLTADAHTFVQRLMPGFVDGGYAAPHKAVLVNVLARCRPAVLLDAADALERTRVGLALALADLARLRHRMLAELDADT